MEHAKVIRVEVVTAVALPPERAAALARRARAGDGRGRDVQLETRVDAVDHRRRRSRASGSTVYDGSVTRSSRR